MTLYPAGVSVPEKLLTDEFLLRPLLAGDVELDYEALMTSKEMLRRWEGGTWPADDFTPSENLMDLVRHELEHVEGLAYTYTVMNPIQDHCLGCVYVDPLDRILESNLNLDSEALMNRDHYEAIVRFWVIQPRLVDDLDRRLLAALIHWFQDEWIFDSVYYRVNERDERQQALMQEAGLTRRFIVEVPGINGRYLIFG